MVQNARTLQFIPVIRDTGALSADAIDARKEQLGDALLAALLHVGVTLGDSSGELLGDDAFDDAIDHLATLIEKRTR